MRTLPDNPNPDHLRRQAKDLLAGLRDSRPEVALAEAQALLADQYGFRTWPDLKAEVDRRRGRADLADEAQARAVAAHFGLGAITGPMRSLAPPDAAGRRWVLKTERGRWAVRTVDTWHPIVDAEADVALQEAAAAAGVLLPLPVRSRTGAVVEWVAGHRWRAYQWVPSGPPLAAPVSAAVASAVGHVLATLHGLALPVARISPYHAGRLSPFGWREVADEAAARGAGWAPALRDAVPTLADLEPIGEGVPPPPPVLCHNTLGPACGRLGAGGRLLVTGWEHAGGQPPGWELVSALLQWTVGPAPAPSLAGARAMIEGYRAQAGSLPPLGLRMFRGAAIGLLNYLGDQVEEALATGDAERRREAERSLGHLLGHLPSRTGLERLLEAALAPAA